MRDWSCRTLLLALLACSTMTAMATEFAQPRPGLHTGGQPSAQDLAAFAQQGVHTVIDLRTAEEPRGFDEAATAQRLGLQYLLLPIEGGDGLTAANAAALHQLLAQHGDGILLHCASGNRVGALLALAVAQHDGMAPEAALLLGREAGMTSLEPIVTQQLGLPAQE